MFGGDGADAGEGRSMEGVVGKEIDLAGDPAGGLEEGLEGSGLEEGDLGAGPAEAMGEVGGDLVAGQSGQVVADDDALSEGLVDGHGESASQLGLTEEEAETVLGVLQRRVRFPFSDVTASKLGAGVVLAHAGGADWILCQVTSNPYGDPSAVPGTADSFATGGLGRESLARPGKLFSASETLHRTAGQLTSASHRDLVRRVVGVVQSGVR